MVEDIVLDTFPKEAGVYLFISNGEVIYVGSSKNIHQRMVKHRSNIRQGSDHGYKQDLYQFLQSNQFTVELQLTEDYRQLEQQLIEQYNPTYNNHRANTGLGARKGREAEYNKEHYQKYREEALEQMKQYYESNKEQIKQQMKQYYESNKEQIKQQKKQYYESHKEERLEQIKQYKNQLCFYNGQTLTLNALSGRFRRQGIPHPVLEAKKYLIMSNND